MSTDSNPCVCLMNACIHVHKWNFDLFIIIVVFIFLLGALLWFIKFTPVNSIKRFPIIVPSPESVCNFPCCDFSNHNERNQPRRVQGRGFSEANNLEANKSSQSVVNYNVCAAIRYQQKRRNKSKREVKRRPVTLTCCTTYGGGWLG